MTLKLLTTRCLIPVGSLLGSVDNYCMTILTGNETYYLVSHVYIGKDGAYAQGADYKTGDKITGFNKLFGTKFNLSDVPLVENFE